MANKKDIKPRTGRKAESDLVSFLKTLSKGDDAARNVPDMPDPIFDKEMGGMFKRRKKVRR